MRGEAGELAVIRQGSQVIAKNNLFQVNFNLSKGTWTYTDRAGYQIIQNAYTKVVLSDGTVLTTLDSGTSEFMTDPITEDEFGIHQPITFSHQAEGHGLRLHLYLNCYHKKPYVILTVGVENLSGAPIGLEQVTLIDVSPHRGKSQGVVDLGGVPSGYHVFLNMNTPVSHGVREIYDGFRVNLESSTESCYDGVLYDTESKRSLVFGFLSFQKWWSAIQVGYDAQTQSGKAEQHGINHWALYHKCENHRCPPGEEVRSAPVYLNFANPVAESYQLYTELVAKRMKAKPLDRVFSGWRAFANRQEPISAERVAQQIDQIAKNPSYYPLIPGGFEYIQIENDWEQSVGSYEVNRQHFPDGMKSVVDGIHSKGLKAGIRFTPFCVDITSELLQTHPEYFLQEPHEKKPAILVLPEDSGVEVALLDVSHPGAQAHLRERVQQLTDEWGYDLIKADLFAYAIGPMADVENFVWHDQSLTSVELYRLGVQLLNQMVQESKSEVILGAYNTCNGPSIGGFSLNEVLSGYGGYIGEGLWNERHGIKQIANACAAHLPMHGTAWTNELGTLVIDEPRPLNEALVAITIAALSGSIVTCGDDLTSIKPGRAALLSKILPLVGKAAMPADLYENTFPQIWNLRVSSPDESWNVVGVFNWSDQMEEVDFSLESLGLDRSKYYLVHDFWDRQFLGVVRDRLTLFDVPSRSVKLVCLRAEKDVPQLLATDIHFTQGSVEVQSAGWDRHSQSFLAVCKPPRHSKGTLFLHVPEGYVPATTACYGSNYHFHWKKPIYELEFSPTADLVHVSVQFARTSG
ncbi:MAG: alpha-galactosidase [Candidatus Poribacteria bacterium]|nr:alpha-galactosidase [Candidatus Poribacteria bacterium]